MLSHFEYLNKTVTLNLNSPLTVIHGVEERTNVIMPLAVDGIIYNYEGRDIISIPSDRVRAYREFTSQDLNFSTINNINRLIREYISNIIDGSIWLSDCGTVFYTPASSDAPVVLYDCNNELLAMGIFALIAEYYNISNINLFIDEPELYLHPKTQKRLARLLSMFINNGAQIVIKTNSDWLIREFNDMLLIGQSKHIEPSTLQKHYADKFGYTFGFDILYTEDVKVYQVDESSVTEVEVTLNGIECPHVDQVINDSEEKTLDLVYNLTNF